jgi:hypothetical protein
MSYGINKTLMSYTVWNSSSLFKKRYLSFFTDIKSNPAGVMSVFEEGLFA